MEIHPILENDKTNIQLWAVGVKRLDPNVCVRAFLYRSKKLHSTYYLQIRRFTCLNIVNYINDVTLGLLQRADYLLDDVNLTCVKTCTCVIYNADAQFVNTFADALYKLKFEHLKQTRVCRGDVDDPR